ncbi:MAG: ATPase, T2SS/T4P/T4SS family [Planctomycetia bacterium]|jgi:type II secretory ATPase GspE/PulE/Tfp pilus assembly ATPase PilB-like protein
MLRQFGFIALIFAVVACTAGPAFAQLVADPLEAQKLGNQIGGGGKVGGNNRNQNNQPANNANTQPANNNQAETKSTFERGTGNYLNWIKVFASWLVFLLWVHSTNWVSIDCVELKLQYVRWNPIIFGTFLGFYVLSWLLPWFWLGFPLLLIAYIAPLATYIVYRNQQVGDSQKVMTKTHLRYWFATRIINRLGGKMEVEKKEAWEKADIELFAVGGIDEREDRVRLLSARQSPVFNETQGLIAETLARRSMAIMLDYSQETVDLRYLIDGVWHNDEPQPREMLDPVLETLKVLCGLKPEERRARQKGIFSVKYEKTNYDVTFTSQGTSKGERVLVQFESHNVSFESIEETGMRPQTQEKIINILNGENGMVIVSAMPSSGLRTTTNLLLKKTDRFTREFMAVEDEKRPYEKIENVPVMAYQTGDNIEQGKGVHQVIVRAFRMVPSVFVMRDLVDGECVRLLAEQASDEMVVLSTMRAKDCAEALLRVLALETPAKPFAKAIKAVLNQRLVRKLCDECKEAYAPTPQVLQQLGIPGGRVEAFYRPPQEPEKICPKCNGVGYYGRTAVFELMLINDDIRKLLAEGAKTDQIRQAARKAGMQNLQAEGIILVAKGITSLPELMRIMKQ